VSYLREERTGETNHIPERGLGEGIAYIRCCAIGLSLAGLD